MTVHIVSHTHWDREWYLTYEQFRLRLVDLVDRLLDLMDAHDDYAYFHLDGQTIVLEDYLELRPHQEERLRRRIAEGRILIGPWYDMPDEFLVSGESLVRNLALGHRIAARFGTPMPVGYLPDLFGHVAQMPQILRHFGLDNAILWRGFGGREAEYWWEAPDGSRVLMMHLPPEGYCNATRVHLDPARMIERTTKAIAVEASRTVVGQVLLMNGVDHVEPHAVIPQLARQLSESLGERVLHSTLPAYVDAVRAGVHSDGIAEKLEVVHGELRGGEDYANLLPGVFSARTYIKQANTRVQTLLEKQAEPLASFAWMLGAVYPADELRYAWRTLLQNHPHDSICGCSVDAVHEENMTRFARAEQVARAIVDRAADAIARTVPAAPGGSIRLVAINTTGEPFTGSVEAVVDLPYESAEPRRVLDALALDAPVTFWPKDATIAAAPVPFQVLDETDVITFVLMRYDTPWALRARRIRLLFQADIPSCGFRAVDFTVGSQATRAARGNRDARSAENAFLELSINADGTADIEDKRTGVRYERCGLLEDVGDVGDEYNYSPPAVDRRITSADARTVRVTRVADGPLRTAFRIDAELLLPVAASGDRTARADETISNAVSIVIALDDDSPRVSWEVAIDNHARDHRLRITFPIGVDAVADVRAETAFGVVQRPARRPVPKDVRVEMPMSYGPTGAFTEAGGDAAGAIVYGEGLVEYEAVEADNGKASRLALTLLRSVGYLSREDLVTRPSGHAGPGLATPGAQCLGKRMFRLAFEPRAEAPSNNALFARAAVFVAPPHVAPAIGSTPTQGTTGQFLQIDARTGGRVLSALHRAEDGTGLLLRVFNADAAPAALDVRLSKPLSSATAVDFLERPAEPVPLTDGVARIDVGGFKIATLRLT
jgi:2-O-(6-phospho-alpha-D-mannosyl)-D-glycerate hydrolase